MFEISMASIIQPRKGRSEPKHVEKEKFMLAFHFSDELMKVYGILG